MPKDYTRRERITIIFIICSFLWISYAPLDLFAQGKEFLRLRAGSAVSEGNYVPGQFPTVEYFIAPEDTMEVFVWQCPDLSKNVIIGPDGYISYPLVGRIKVDGLSVSQLEDVLRKKLSEYVKDPHVSVMMTKFAGNKVILLGEVNSTGIFTYKGIATLIDAIALGGDFTTDARRDSVILVRGNLTDKPQVTRINMAKIITRGTTDRSIILQPNDVIFVPKTFVANLNKFLRDISPLISGANSILDARERVKRMQGYER